MSNWAEKYFEQKPRKRWTPAGEASARHPKSDDHWCGQFNFFFLIFNATISWVLAKWYFSSNGKHTFVLQRKSFYYANYYFQKELDKLIKELKKCTNQRQRVKLLNTTSKAARSCLTSISAASFHATKLCDELNQTDTNKPCLPDESVRNLAKLLHGK